MVAPCELPGLGLVAVVRPELLGLDPAYRLSAD
jgi:hypothetical protein